MSLDIGITANTDSIIQDTDNDELVELISSWNNGIEVSISNPFLICTESIHFSDLKNKCQPIF
ncbi:MAG: hypothetical protein EOM67_12850 [Spirochaetia bacterium]|nr:hypothetical protein [Spirochaetia bacterium]